MNLRPPKPRLVPLLLLIVAPLFFSIARAETPIAGSQPSSEYLQSWLLCGPFALQGDEGTITTVAHQPGFETDFLASIGGEANPAIAEGGKVGTGSETKTWMAFTAAEPSLDFESAFGKADGVAAYAYCQVEADDNTACTLSLGSNDGGKGWLNGEVVWDHPGPRRLTPDEDSVPVRLRKGKNTLLFKIEDRGDKWGLSARFLPFDPSTYLANNALFRIAKDSSGKASLCFAHPGWIADSLFKQVGLQVRRRGDPSGVVLETEWKGEERLPLDLPSEPYQEFQAQIRAVVADGSEWTAALELSTGKRETFPLFENGTTDYSIVVAANCSESERWAAEELAKGLGQTSGATFPIRSSSENPLPHEIVVGNNERARQLLGADLPVFDASDETFLYRNVGSSIVILGGSGRGTMYGVMSFLEREMGCRWYTPRVTVTSKKDRYDFEYLYHTESPKIRVRNDFYFEAFEPIWAAHNRVNGAMGFRVQPGGVESYWAVHTFFPLMPPTEFFESHPEYYSLIDGVRTHERAQLCLTNKDVLRIMTERIKTTIRGNPQYLIYSVSQNDWHGPCQCENCQAIAKREESESGPVVWFVNQVAEAIEKEFPDKYIGTLAYQYTRKPCKTIKPRENVVIRLCSIECCFAHDFKTCPENQSFIEDLKGWAAIAPHLYIWDYVVDFSHYLLPYPNFKVLKSNLQTLSESNAIGVMEQAAYQSRGGEFAELRMYLLSKLLWDPDCNEEQVINDFLYGYYGRSGQHVRRYFDLLHGLVSEDTHIHIGMTPEDPLFSNDFIRKAEAIFKEARTVADNEEIRQRVEMAELPVLYLKCKRMPHEAKTEGSYARFCQIVEREDVTLYAEAGAPHKRDFHLDMDSIPE